MVKLDKKEKSAKELLENSYKNIYERDEKGTALCSRRKNSEVISRKRSECECSRCRRIHSVSVQMHG